MSAELGPSELLAKCSVTISPETFAIVSVSKTNWNKLLTSTKTSPRMSAPFMIFMDQHEVTLLLDAIDFANMRSELSDAKVESGYRLLTFDIVLDVTVVGFMAKISRILAEANVPILALSAFSRDHLLIRQNDLVVALGALSPHIK